MGVEGVYINSSLVSAQLRKRYYWTNIPFDKEIKDKGIELQSILEIGYTKCVDYMQAADLLGDGWTIEVIKHIFRGLK